MTVSIAIWKIRVMSHLRYQALFSCGTSHLLNPAIPVFVSYSKLYRAGIRSKFKIYLMGLIDI